MDEHFDRMDQNFDRFLKERRRDHPSKALPEQQARPAGKELTTRRPVSQRTTLSWTGERVTPSKKEPKLEPDLVHSTRLDWPTGNKPAPVFRPIERDHARVSAP